MNMFFFSMMTTMLMTMMNKADSQWYTRVMALPIAVGWGSHVIHHWSLHKCAVLEFRSIRWNIPCIFGSMAQNNQGAVVHCQKSWKCWLFLVERAKELMKKMMIMIILIQGVKYVMKDEKDQLDELNKEDTTFKQSIADHTERCTSRPDSVPFFFFIAFLPNGSSPLRKWSTCWNQISQMAMKTGMRVVLWWWCWWFHALSQSIVTAQAELAEKKRKNIDEKWWRKN